MYSLGIDIGDSDVTGVVLEQQRKTVVLKACATLPLQDVNDPAEQIELLCRQLDWREGVVVCGLPLSLFSIRNITLPFTDSKRIAQILPFELEEQLPAPIDTLLTEFVVSRREKTGNMVVAFALEQHLLENLLTRTGSSVDPDIIVPSMVSLAVLLTRLEKTWSDFLLIHTDQQSCSLVFVLDGQAQLYRSLAYPEQLAAHLSGHDNGDDLPVSDVAVAREHIRHLCRLIEQSLQYFQIEQKENRHPKRIILSGPLAGVECVREEMASVFSLPVESLALMTDTALFCGEEIEAQQEEQQYGCALALAMQGFKRPEINFRKEQFAKKRNIFKTRRQLQGALVTTVLLLVGALGFLWYDYHTLQQRNQALGDEMTAIFQQTFAGVPVVRDPFAEMQARVKSATGPASPSSPLLHNDRRVLGLLTDISRRIPSSVHLRVNRLTIDQETVVIKGTTDTFNAVETMKSVLAGSPHFKSVQIVSAAADKADKHGGIRFEMQLLLEDV